MFRKKNTSERPTIRTRRPAGTLNESFRRNNVVLSRRQQEVAQHQQSVSQRQAERKRQQKWRRTRNKAIIVFLAILAGAGLYQSSVMQVEVVSNASTRLSEQQAQEYSASFLTKFNENSLFNQAWLVDAEAAKAAMLAAYPEIERINLSSSLFSKTAKADIRFREPVFTWKDASGTPQFVDQHGVLFSKNLNPAVNADKLIAIEDQSGVVLEAGSSVLTEQLVQFVGQLYSKVPSLYGEGSRVEQVIIPKSTREVHLKVKDVPYIIKFNSTRNIDEQVGELNTLLSHLRASNITPAQYIDLRVAHKAFYK